MKIIAKPYVVCSICVAISAGAAAQDLPGSPVEAAQRVSQKLTEPPLAATVRNAPYSGEGTTTVSQTLADGTRIERSWVMKVFRDSEGRVRREQIIAGLEQLSVSGDEPNVVTIADPVVGVNYVLQVGAKVARRTVRGRGEPVDILPPPPPPPPPPGEPHARGRSNAANVANMPQPLGTRQIEGLAAVGTRRTEVIPIGRIGNDRPIEITDERWESPELKVVLLSRHHDPRTGDIEYRLTNINRAEPPRALFIVPQDYMIVDGPPPPPAPRRPE